MTRSVPGFKDAVSPRLEHWGGKENKKTWRIISFQKVLNVLLSLQISGFCLVFNTHSSEVKSAPGDVTKGTANSLLFQGCGLDFEQGENS